MTTAPLPFVEQTQLPLQPRIRTRHGTMAVSSLRPGDFLESDNHSPIIVMINSGKLRKVVIKLKYLDEFPSPYENISKHCRYLGQGKPRKWLPKFLHGLICPFSQPSA